MKKLLSIILAVLMVVPMLPMAVLPASAASAAETCICTTKCIEGSVNGECTVCSTDGAELSACAGSYTYDEATNTYVIYNKAGLDAWRTAATSDVSTNLTLACDIEYNASWSMLDITYSGTIDGKGYAIVGLNCSGTSHASFIYVLGSEGVIKHLGMVGGSFSNSKSSLGCGSAAFLQGNKGIIMGCYNTSSCTSAGNSDDYGWASGISYENAGKVVACYNAGTISAGGDRGSGICGTNEGVISGCYNTGAVSGKGASYAYYASAITSANRKTINDCYYTQPSTGYKNYDSGIATNITKVTGSDWTAAMNAMNAAIEAYNADESNAVKCNYRYIINKESATKANQPLVLVCQHIADEPEWVSNQNGTHSANCDTCDLTYTMSCSGGTATCTTQAVCEVCGASYGELAAHTPDTNGKCTVDGCGYQYAAKVGDSFYETIHKALRAAEGINGCTLTLLDDVTLSSMSSYASYVNTGTFTLDLNGKNLSSNKRTLEVMGSADLTIRDSIGGGKIVSTDSSAVYLSGGKLNIESGTFEGTLDGVFLSGTSTLIVKGGTFTGSRAMITGFGSNVEIDLTAIDPSGLTLKNNGSGTFAPKLPEGYGMVGSDGKLLTSLSAEQSATVHKHEYKYTDLGDGNHQQACSCGQTTGEPAAHSTTAEDDKAATCIAPAYCSVCDSEYGDVDKTNHDETVAYENGFCENGCYEPATLNAEGYYEIDNAGKLFWFAQQVNIEGNAAANGKLMADIDLENRTWYPIGLYNDIAEANGSPVQQQYAGTFDGNNHTVSNFTAIGNGSQGLFGYCNYSSAQIKNLGVINATVSGWNAGAVAGYCANLTNCYAVGCTITGASDTNTDAVTISSVGGNNGPTAIVNCWAYDCELIVGEGEENYVMHPVGGIRTSNSSGNIVQNCYYGEIVTDAEFTSTTGAVEKTEAQFASGEVAYLLSGDQSTITFKQTLGTDAYPSFTGGTVYQVENCKGELGYSNTNENIGHQWVNGTCTVCEYACPHEKYTDGVCDKCDHECPHEWGEGVLTRPTFETAGYYTYTCTLCGHSYTEPTKRADDTALNDASVKVMEYIGNSTLTQEALDEIDKSYRDILKNNGNVFDEFGFVRGDLVEEDQPAINAVTAELEKIIADADEKIASGEYVKADYTEIDEAIAKIEQKLTDENITDEGKAGLEEIKAQLEKMKADENTSKADLAELEKELEAYEEELDKGIEDGTLVEIDVYKIGTELSDRWTERLEAEGLTDEYKDFIDNQKATDEALAAEKEIIDFMASLEGTVAENAENIAKLNEMNNSLCASFENCLRGTHNFNDYEVTSPAKCEVNAKETSTCWFCGETDEREVEGTALKHSYTKYEVTEEAECGKAGKEVASCDHGCGATDEKEIEALEHADKDGDYLCDHGCGHEFEKPVEPEQPDDPSEKCDHLCHKDGILGFLWKIISFFYRLFNIQQYCDCGVIHYAAPVFG